MNTKVTYAEAIKKAAAFREIGMRDIDLFEGEMPWHIASSCEPGGTHRNGIPVSVRFSGTNADASLRFSWYFDLEKREANGKGYYEIDTAACRDVMAQLPNECQEMFGRYLLECAKAVDAKAAEYQAVADHQTLYAKTLRSLVSA